MKYLIDTNVISELTKLQPNKAVTHFLREAKVSDLYLSVLSIGEIRKGIEQLQDLQKKQKLKLWLEADLAKFFSGRIIDINKDVANKWGFLIAGLKKTVPAIDSLIAATAITHDLTLVTQNIEDFAMFQLEIFNPWLHTQAMP